MTNEAKQTVINQLNEARTAEFMAAGARRQAVAALRNEHGMTWTAIAALLGITKQAATKTYSDYCEAAFTRTMRQARDEWRVAGDAVDVPLDLETPEVVAVEQLAAVYVPQPVQMYVVPCGAAKSSRPAAAGELYMGEHFRRTLRLVQAAAARSGASVRILSALHGLVDPTTVLAPYDVTIGSVSSVDLAVRVADQLRGVDVVHAWVPKAYAAVLMGATAEAGVAFVDEFAGTRGIGDQRALLGAL